MDAPEWWHWMVLGLLLTLAEASLQAIAKVTRAFGDNELPMLYLLGEKYIGNLGSFGSFGSFGSLGSLGSLGKLAESDNAKVVLLPADLQSTLRGLFQRVTKADH